MNDHIYSAPPLDLLEKLKSYPRILSMVELDWGTTRLDEFLLELVSDSYRGNTKRQGFPLDVFDAITKLQLFNLSYLKDQGIIPEDDDNLNSRFGLDMWDLPKNF